MRSLLHSFQALAVVILLAVSLVPGQSQAQTEERIDSPDLFYRDYTTRDGLLSDHVYQIYRDQQNYLWIASEAGVSRFNGTEFEHFGQDKGMFGGECFGFYEDPDNNLWAYGFVGYMAKFDGERFEVPAFCDSLRNLGERVGNVISWLVHDTAGNLIIQASRAIKVTPNGQLELMEVFGPGQAGIDTLLYVKEVGKDAYLFRQIRKRGIIGDMVFQFEGKRQKHEVLVPQYLNRKYGRTMVLRHSSGTEIVQFRKSLFFMKDDDHLIHSEIPDQMNQCMVEDSAGLMWVGLQLKGAMAYDVNTGEVVKHFLDGYSVTSLAIDREGGYWFSTAGQGLFYVPKIDILAFVNSSVEEKTKVNGIGWSREAQKFVWSFRNGEISVLSLEKGLQRKRYSVDIGRIFIAGFGAGNYILDGVLESAFLNLENDSIWTEDDIFRGRLISSDTLSYRVQLGAYGLHAHQVGDTHSRHEANPSGGQSSAVYRFLDTPSHEWYASSHDNLWYQKGPGDPWESLMDDGGIPRFFTGGMMRSSGDSIWVGSQGEGLYLVYRGKVLRHLTTTEGLPSNYCNAIFGGGKDLVWYCSNSGLARLDLKGTRAEIKVFDIEWGLPSNNVLRGARSDSLIVLATDRGICLFDPDRPAEPMPRALMKQVECRLGPHEPILEEGAVLTYDQSSLQFNFRALAFRNAGRIPYRYRLAGLSEDWDSTSTGRVVYPYLSPGGYSFEVQAANAAGVWSVSEVFSFEIQPPYWQTWWFISLLVLVGGLMLFGVFRWRVRQVRSRLEVVEQMYAARNQAFSAQMNPHFIYNSLNSVVQYLAQNDERTSLRFLARFARLMRNVFDNSQRTLIPLSDELEALERYLELESMRLKDQMSYRIELAEGLKTFDFLVPALLLQPFAENAIWHGLSPKGSGGELVVRLEPISKGIRCIIEDNGVGRGATSAKSDDLERGSERSMTLIHRRLDLIGKMYGQQPSFTVEDLIRDGEPAGTRVVLDLPLLQDD